MTADLGPERSQLPWPTTAEAVAASVACARALGLPVEEPEVIAEGFSVRVHLRPSPVVSRVVTTGQQLRGKPRPWLEREVAVGQFLARSDVAIVAPWEEPGPHRVDGTDVTLWSWVEDTGGLVSAAEFGVMLGELHTALASYAPDLPTLVGPLTDIAAAVSRVDDPLLHRAADVLVPLAMDWPRRPLHGDAHTGNVLMTRDGPRWSDFEDVCAGPVEWDLASLTLTDEAVDAYPGHIDRTRLEECRDLRRLQVLSYLLVEDAHEPQLLESLTSALRWRL
ncbi:aminoglycoside phosphotransferase family protein [Nocardioides seonyuensis]|uniref:Aminoglycoside phosphotransferase family protein n=1 Tax=Nocardioides seonyuensis TaxID=2518371 RepID=A0A4P7IGD0_9ACTN|nr:phosphotransferase [Nocardioides seonyuensis]QBX56336.1 aminoglycoside phosphotransferase family protein [Nocardioides seonyuensis]